MPRTYTFRTITQIRYILANYEDQTNRQIGAHLGLSADQVRSVLRINGITKARSRGYRKGCIPHNKGRRMRPETYQKVARTMFKPGNRPATAKPPGAIRHTKDGPYIKTDHGRRWVSIRRYIWEQTYGPIPPSHVIIITAPDADPHNPQPQHLQAIHRGQLAQQNRQQSNRATK